MNVMSKTTSQTLVTKSSRMVIKTRRRLVVTRQGVSALYERSTRYSPSGFYIRGADRHPVALGACVVKRRWLYHSLPLGGVGAHRFNLTVNWNENEGWYINVGTRRKSRTLGRRSNIKRRKVSE